MRVIGPVGGLIDGQRPFQASARVVQVPEIVQEDAKVAERDCHLRVVRPIRGLERQMWGDEFGMCMDQFGVPGMVNITQPTAPA